MRKDMWRCECSAKNYDFRIECWRCGTPKQEPSSSNSVSTPPEPCAANCKQGTEAGVIRDCEDL